MTSKRRRVTININKVFDRLYIGSREARRELAELRITHVFSILSTAERLSPDYTSIVLPPNVIEYCYTIRDGWAGQFAPLTERCLPHIRELLVENGEHQVLVHCGAGQSRSAAVIMAYLLTYGDDKQCRPATVDEALAILRKRRPNVNPHPHWLEELDRYISLFNETVP